MTTLHCCIIRCAIAAAIGMAPALAPAQGAGGAGKAGEATAAPGTAPASVAEMTEAEVRRVDIAGAKLTLRHGEIRNLDMPPMTMVFRVRDPKALEGLAVGDRVRFTAEKVDGNFTVTSIDKAP